MSIQGALLSDAPADLSVARWLSQVSIPELARTRGLFAACCCCCCLQSGAASACSLLLLAADGCCCCSLLLLLCLQPGAVSTCSLLLLACSMLVCSLLLLLLLAAWCCRQDVVVGIYPRSLILPAPYCRLGHQAPQCDVSPQCPNHLWLAAVSGLMLLLST